MQLNVTRYQAAESLRWTLIVREPNDQLEVTRWVVETTEHTVEVTTALQVAIGQALAHMRYLQASRND